MKRKLLSLALSSATLMFACILATPAWSAGRYEVANHNQHKRIVRGVKSGQITCGELKKLRNEQCKIHRFSRRAHADGHVSRSEHRKMINMRKQASRNIYRAKHNRKAYGSCRAVPRGHCPPPQRATPRHHGAFSGSVVQPGLSLAWNVGLR